MTAFVRHDSTRGFRCAFLCLAFLSMPGVACDAERGARVFTQCAICHSRSPDGAAMVGPNLWAIVGRPAGRASGFQYSRALSARDILWTESALNDFLTKPDAYIPGTQMAFDGIAKQADRDAVICLLSKLE